MPEIQPPSYSEDGCVTAQQDRLLWGSVICQEGVVAGEGFDASHDGGANLNVTVSAGEAWIQGDDIANQGVYFVSSDSDVTVTLDPADPTDDRIDLIVARVYDTGVVGSGDPEWHIEVVTGQPSPAPIPPTLPASAIPLWRVRVPAGSSGANITLTDTREQMLLCPGQLRGAFQPIEIPDGAHLDTYTTSGWYIQSESDGATPAADLGYPGLVVRAGWLEVATNETGRFTWQRYTEYSSGGRQPNPREWVRHFNNTRNPQWTAWNQVSGAVQWHQVMTNGSGWTGGTPSPIPPAEEWGMALIDNRVYIRARLTSTTEIEVDGQGNIVGNVAIGTITDPAYRPFTDVRVQAVNSGNYATCWILIRPSGEYLMTHSTYIGGTFFDGTKFDITDSYIVYGDG